MAIQKPLPSQEELELMDEDEKKQFAHDFYSGAFKHAGLKPTFKQKMKYQFSGLLSIFIGLIAIAVVYGIVNIVFIGGQNLWHSGDKSHLNSIKSDLEAKKKIISKYEYDNSLGILTESEYSRYKETVQEYNNEVKEYNELAKKVGTTWYVVPIPK